MQRKYCVLCGKWRVEDIAGVIGGELDDQTRAGSGRKGSGCHVRSLAASLAVSLDVFRYCNI